MKTWRTFAVWNESSSFTRCFRASSASIYREKPSSPCCSQYVFNIFILSVRTVEEFIHTIHDVSNLGNVLNFNVGINDFLRMNSAHITWLFTHMDWRAGDSWCLNHGEWDLLPVVLAELKRFKKLPTTLKEKVVLECPGERFKSSSLWLLWKQKHGVVYFSVK